MIIEAGYDILELFAPKLFIKRVSKTKRGTWVLAMDEDLRNLHVTEVGGDASEPIENRLAHIVTALNERSFRPVAYYALAQLDTDLRGDYKGTFDHLLETLELAPELIDYELLCTYLSNGKGFYSSGLRYSFRDYVGYEHLPRAASIPGPHDFHCSCLACTQHEEMLQRNREQHRAAQAEKS